MDSKREQIDIAKDKYPESKARELLLHILVNVPDLDFIGKYDVEDLVVEFCNGIVYDLTPLSGLKNLKRLWVKRWWGNGQPYKGIAKLTGLEYLKINDTILNPKYPKMVWPKQTVEKYSHITSISTFAGITQYFITTSGMPEDVKTAFYGIVSEDSIGASNFIIQVYNNSRQLIYHTREGNNTDDICVKKLTKRQLDGLLGKQPPKAKDLVEDFRD